MTTTALKVAILSAPSDDDAAKALLRHLSVLQQQGAIQIWWSGNIPAGKEICNEQRRELERADVVILLLSADLMSDKSTVNLVGEAAGEKLFPVKLYEVFLGSHPLASRQLLPRDGKPLYPRDNPEAAWAEIVQEIHQKVVTWRRKRPGEQAPVIAAEWLQACQEGQLVLILGPRLATDANLPDRDKLLEDLLSQGNVPAKKTAGWHMEQLLRAATPLGWLEEQIAKRMKAPGTQPTALHWALARILVQGSVRFVQTTQDLLLLQATTQRDEHSTQLDWIYGRVDEPGSLRLALSPPQRTELRASLAPQLQGKRKLLVGFENIPTDDVVDDLKAICGDDIVYWLVAGGESETETTAIENSATELGWQPVWLHERGGEALWVERLEALVYRRRRPALAMAQQALQQVLSSGDEALSTASERFTKEDYHGARDSSDSVVTLLAALLQQNPKDESIQRRLSEARLSLGMALLCLQEVDLAGQQAEAAEPKWLPPAKQVTLAALLIQTGHEDQAEQILNKTEAEVDTEPCWQLLALHRGRMPATLHPSLMVQSEAAVLWERQGRLVNAQFCSSRVLEATADHTLFLLSATSVLLRCLDRSVWEFPPAIEYLPQECWPQVVGQVTQGLDRLSGRRIESPLTDELLAMKAHFAWLLLDWEALNLANQSSSQQPRENPTQHPWFDSWLQAKQALRDGDLVAALAKAQAAQDAHPGKIPIQQILAETLFRLKRYDQAEHHARSAFVALPGPGHRRQLVHILMAQNRREKVAEAWELLDVSPEHETADQLFYRAQAAEEMAPAESMSLWERYLTLSPNDPQIWLRLAVLRFMKGQQSAAAAASWHAMEVEAKLSVQDLGQIALFQRTNQEFTSSEITERLTSIANKLRSEYPEDPKAEQLRLELLIQLDTEARQQVEPIRFDMLVKHGLVIAGTGVEEIKHAIQRIQGQQAGTIWLYRAGLLPYEALGIRTGLLAQRALQVQEQSEPLLATFIPVRHHEFSLPGSILLTSPLELLLLQEFGFLDSLKRTLGPCGKFVVLKQAYEKLLQEKAELNSERAQSEEQQRNRERLSEVCHFLYEGRAHNWIEFVDRPLVKLKTLGEESLFVEPWREALGYRQLLVEHKDWLFLCVDHLTAGLFGGGDFTPYWLQDVNPVQADFVDLIEPMHSTADRIISLPELVRRLLGKESKKPLFLRLLRLGFIDALLAKDLAWAAKDPSLLAQLERVAWLPLVPPDELEPKAKHDHQATAHPGRRSAIRYLAQLYSDAIVDRFCQSIEVDESRQMATRLLSRMEALPDSALDWMLFLLCMKIVGHGSHAFNETEGRLSQESKLGELWGFLWNWAAGKPRLEILLSRSLRIAICQVDLSLSSDTSAKLAVAPLVLGIRDDEANIAILIFDALRSKTGNSQWDPVICSAAAALEQSRENLLSAGAAFWDVRLDKTPYELPAEAVLLSLKDSHLPDHARLLAALQRLQDGRAYRWLMNLANEPRSSALRHGYAQFTIMAPWRLIREDPTLLLDFANLSDLPLQQWPHGIDELREMLLEPSGNLPFHSLVQSIHERFEAGFEVGEEQAGGLYLRWELLDHTCAVPGMLALSGVNVTLDHPEYRQWARHALDRLRNHREQPTGRVVRDLLTLRRAAEQRPRLQLSDSEVIDLRQLLPVLLTSILTETVKALRKEPELLDQTRELPRPERHLPERHLIDQEPALLRLCAQVVQQLASRSGGISLRDGVWLTYRLFNWFWLQMESLEEDRRRAALKALVAAAPAPLPNPTPDLFNPWGFSPSRMEYRLVSLLFALCQMELVLPTGEPGSIALRAVSSPALEEELLALASSLKESEADKDLRAIVLQQEPSVLGWISGTPASVPQLALLALLLRNRESFGRLPEDKRLRWIERLPRKAEDADAVGARLVSPILVAAADRSVNLDLQQRQTLLERTTRLVGEGLAWAPPDLRNAWESAAFFALIRLYELGAVELYVLLQRLFTDRLQETFTKELFEDYLIALSFTDEDLMESECRRVLAQVQAHGQDPSPWALALGTVLNWGSPGGKRRARELLGTLAAEPRYRHYEPLLHLFQTLPKS